MPCFMYSKFRGNLHNQGFFGVGKRKISQLRRSNIAFDHFKLNKKILEILMARIQISNDYGSDFLEFSTIAKVDKMIVEKVSFWRNIANPLLLLTGIWYAVLGSIRVGEWKTIHANVSPSEL